MANGGGARPPGGAPGRAADPGRRAGGRPRVVLEPGMAAARAVGRILAWTAAVAERNVPGVVADADPEHLHDLRVAVRRTRSLLGQVPGVFAKRRLAPLRRELGWIGAITGPCRDLDILLRDLTALRPGPGWGPDLEPLLALAAEDRGREHRRLVRRLGTLRFAAAVDRWKGFAARADTPALAGPRAGEPVLPLANERILRAHRRLIRHGEALGGAPPAEALHRLRIDAKKLRYLLELFASLYPAAGIRPLIRRLKGLQDLLGSLNDAAVQRRWLQERATRRAAARPGAERLDAMLRRRQEALRDGFAARFAGLRDRESRRAWRQLFGGEG